MFAHFHADGKKLFLKILQNIRKTISLLMLGVKLLSPLTHVVSILSAYLDHFAATESRSSESLVIFLLLNSQLSESNAESFHLCMPGNTWRVVNVGNLF